MQINISARHGNLSAETQAIITEKVDRIRKFYDRVTSIHVTVDMEHREAPSVELVITAEHSDEFVGRDTAATVLTALDSVIHKVEMQVRKHKEKVTDRRAVGHKHLDVPTPGDE